MTVKIKSGDWLPIPKQGEKPCEVLAVLSYKNIHGGWVTGSSNEKIGTRILPTWTHYAAIEIEPPEQEPTGLDAEPEYKEYTVKRRITRSGIPLSGVETIKGGILLQLSEAIARGGICIYENAKGNRIECGAIPYVFVGEEWDDAALDYTEWNDIPSNDYSRQIFPVAIKMPIYPQEGEQ